MKKPELLYPGEILLAQEILKLRRLSKKNRLLKSVRAALYFKVGLASLMRIEHIPSATLRKFIKKSIEQGAQ